MLVNRLEDVIFAEIALNYEEGKWIVLEQKATFLADSYVHTTQSGIMAGFLAGKGQSGWKHGDFISGCAIRLDAKYILDHVSTTVST